MKTRCVLCLLMVCGISGPVTAAALSLDGYKYRTRLRIGASAYARQDKPVEVEIDFSDLVRRLGPADYVDPTHSTVVEQRGEGVVGFCVC